MLGLEDLIEVYTKAGLKKGDVICLQSSYKGLGKLEGGPLTLVKAIIDIIGEEGTLLMPAYNFKSWTEEHYFDIRETPSGVGLITEVFRKMDGVKRTKHPIHSLSVWGKFRDEICNIDVENSFDENSVFSFLLKLNAVYSTAGLGLEMPFLPCHLAEKQKNVPYRRLKKFSGTYVGYDGKPELKTYSLDVRKDCYMNTRTPIYSTHIMLYELDVFKKIEHKNVLFCYGTASNYNSNLLKIIDENKEMFGW